MKRKATSQQDKDGKKAKVSSTLESVFIKQATCGYCEKIVFGSVSQCPITLKIVCHTCVQDFEDGADNQGWGCLFCPSDGWVHHVKRATVFERVLKDMGEHLQTTCPQSKCGQTMSWSASKDHGQTCVHTPIECPLCDSFEGTTSTSFAYHIRREHYGSDKCDSKPYISFKDAEGRECEDTDDVALIAIYIKEVDVKKRPKTYLLAFDPKGTCPSVKLSQYDLSGSFFVDATVTLKKSRVWHSFQAHLFT